MLVSSTLRTGSHTDRACVSAWEMVASIRRSFGRLSLESLLIMYASHLRPHMEYGIPASFLFEGGGTVNLDRVQRAALPMVVGLLGFSYECRLQATGLFPPPYRKTWGI